MTELKSPYDEPPNFDLSARETKETPSPVVV